MPRCRDAAMPRCRDAAMPRWPDGQMVADDRIADAKINDYRFQIKD